jgi:hypothetical protein
METVSSGEMETKAKDLELRHYVHSFSKILQTLILHILIDFQNW